MTNPTVECDICGKLHEWSRGASSTYRETALASGEFIDHCADHTAQEVMAVIVARSNPNSGYAVPCQACEGIGECTFELEYDPGRPWSDDGPAHEERVLTCTECGGDGSVDLETYQDQTERGGGESCRDSMIELELLR
jgi:hypothetical protein